MYSPTFLVPFLQIFQFTFMLIYYKIYISIQKYSVHFANALFLLLKGEIQSFLYSFELVSRYIALCKLCVWGLLRAQEL